MLGVTRALGERGIDGDDPQMLIHVEATEWGGYLAARQVLALRPRPDGVIIDNPRRAMGFLRGAADLGVSVLGGTGGTGGAVFLTPLPAAAHPIIPGRRVGCWSSSSAWCGRTDAFANLGRPVPPSAQTALTCADASSCKALPEGHRRGRALV
ncbi:hypothetical protein ACIHFD_07650 [Nonomuraea sp. NPDC051941]|uniref:hypothetical protein n=1 Tax=Nonomuraea sp. NPDC051941 TaxID=3364373 RepID=UPI0037CA0942